MLKVFVLGMRSSLPDGSLPAKEAPRPARGGDAGAGLVLLALVVAVVHARRDRGGDADYTGALMNIRRAGPPGHLTTRRPLLIRCLIRKKETGCVYNLGLG